MTNTQNVFRCFLLIYCVLRFGGQVQIRLHYCFNLIFQITVFCLLTPMCSYMNLVDLLSTHVKYSVLSSFIKPCFPSPTQTAMSLAMTQRIYQSFNYRYILNCLCFFSSNDLGEFNNMSSGPYCFDGYKTLISYLILSFFGNSYDQVLPGSAAMEKCTSVLHCQRDVSG